MGSFTVKNRGVAYYAENFLTDDLLSSQEWFPFMVIFSLGGDWFKLHPYLPE